MRKKLPYDGVPMIGDPLDLQCLTVNGVCKPTEWGKSQLAHPREDELN